MLKCGNSAETADTRICPVSLLSAPMRITHILSFSLGHACDGSDGRLVPNPYSLFQRHFSPQGALLSNLYPLLLILTI